MSRIVRDMVGDHVYDWVAVSSSNTVGDLPRYGHIPASIHISISSMILRDVEDKNWD
jgi:hypothetical protein